jgi:hypothetical protein
MNWPPLSAKTQGAAADEALVAGAYTAEPSPPILAPVRAPSPCHDGCIMWKVVLETGALSSLIAVTTATLIISRARAEL